MKSFFEYTMTTECGFPSVQLEGSLEDWVQLRENAKGLLENLCLSEFNEFWAPALLDTLDRFISTYKSVQNDGALALNEADQTFWNSMIKRGAVVGSGGY